jgi:hypothetical protein
MKTALLIIMLLAVSGLAVPANIVVNSGVNADLVAAFNTTSANGDTISISGAYHNSTTLNVKRGVYVRGLNFTFIDRVATWGDSVVWHPQGSASCFSLADTGTTFYGLNLTTADTNADAAGACYVYTSNGKYNGKILNCRIHRARGRANIRGLTITRAGGSKADPTSFLLRKCFLDSTAVSISGYDAHRGHSINYDSCIGYKVNLGSGYRGKTSWNLFYSNNGGSGQFTIASCYDTVEYNFVNANAANAELFSAGGAENPCSSGVFRYNTITNGAHVTLMTDSLFRWSFYNNTIQHNEGTLLYNHGNGAGDFNTYTNNLFISNVAFIAYINTKAVSDNTWQWNGWLCQNAAASNTIAFATQDMRDSLIQDVYYTGGSYPTTTNTNGGYRDTTHADSSACFINAFPYGYLRQHSSNRAVRWGVAHASDTIRGTSKKWLTNFINTCGVTPTTFGLICSTDVLFRYPGAYSAATWNWNNPWFVGDTLMTYGQDSVYGSGAWRTFDSTKCVAGHRDTLWDSLSGISGNTVAHRLIGKSLGYVAFRDTAFIQQSSLTLAASNCIVEIHNGTHGRVRFTK